MLVQSKNVIGMIKINVRVCGHVRYAGMIDRE